MSGEARISFDFSGLARLELNGAAILKGAQDAAAQAQLLEEVRACAREAPPVRFETPSGRRMSVAMTSAGRVGWTASRRGYAYAPLSASGAPWPAIPPTASAVWRAVSGWAGAPDCCVINWYGEGERRRLGAGRDGPAGPSRRRQDPLRRVLPAGQGRAVEPDDAGGALRLSVGAGISSARSRPSSRGGSRPCLAAKPLLDRRNTPSRSTPAPGPAGPRRRRRGRRP